MNLLVIVYLIKVIKIAANDMVMKKIAYRGIVINIKETR